MIKIIFNRWLPFKPYAALSLGDRIFVRNEYEGKVTKSLIAHELVHVSQVERMGMVKYLATWVWEYFTKGYKNISLEKEAYEKQSEDYYLAWAESVLKDNGIAYPK